MIRILPYWPLLVASTPVLASATLNNPVQQRQLTDFPLKATGRFCEGGGHRCSAPKECCPQGCCYLFAPPSPPKAPTPVTDHVLNLFLVNHWYFWCVILAIVLVLLCVCTLWRKRRQLCGWGSSGGHHQHSEGDSAGSCYLPPQYSRCSSFHHAPPPYTEVTSKPDLYPLVFTCNGGGVEGGNGGVGGGVGNGGNGFGKNGTGYLMVHYFRNYIVRPVGSLSATSTVDSLSSSFICTVNEANTIVPPPYSRAASPGGGGGVTGNEVATIATTGTTTPRLDSHQSQQQLNSQSQVLLAQTDFNHIARSESMQQERSRSGDEMMMVMQHQQQPDFHYCHNNEEFVTASSTMRGSQHPVITGRSLSAPLVDDYSVEVETSSSSPMAMTTAAEEVAASRRVTVDWGNGCYANVDCSTGCGRERFHNHSQQHRIETQRRSGGINVNVVVEAGAAMPTNGRQSFCGQEIKTNNSHHHNNKVDRSRTPSFERNAIIMGEQQTALDRMMTGGGGGGGVGLPGSCHNNMTAVDGELSGINRSFGGSGGGATVCYSRSEYELRKVKLSSAGMATAAPNGFGGGGRSLESNDSVLQTNGLFGYYNPEIEAYRNHQKPPSPRPSSYHHHRGEAASAAAIESGHQMDRLTDELNELFNNVEMALNRVPSRNDRTKKQQRKSGSSLVDAQFNHGGEGGDGGIISQSVLSPAEHKEHDLLNAEETPDDSHFLMDEVFEKSFSDLRLDLGARARLMQRQMSMDQESSSRRDYMESPLNNKSMMGSNPFDNLMYMNSSNTGSAVSSLVNMDSPSSPPQATSPTDEMRELLEQINQLQRSEHEGEVELGHHVAIEDARDEEERIMERLRRDSDEDNSAQRQLREEETRGRRIKDNDRMADEESLQSDWMMLNDGGSRTNKNTTNNNSSAKNTDNNHSNNKSTKRPLSFQNNSHILNSLLLMAAGTDDDIMPDEHRRDVEEEGERDGLHNNRNVAPVTRTQQHRNSSFYAKDFSTSSSNYSNNSGHVGGTGRTSGGVATSCSKPNKSFYIPVNMHSPTATGMSGFHLDGRTTGRKLLSPRGSAVASGQAKGPIRTMNSPTTSGGFFPGMILGARKLSRLSRSAPTTPGTALPPRFDDKSPLLLDEHEEEENV